MPWSPLQEKRSSPSFWWSWERSVHQRPWQRTTVEKRKGSPGGHFQWRFQEGPPPPCHLQHWKVWHSQQNQKKQIERPRANEKHNTLNACAQRSCITARQERRRRVHYGKWVTVNQSKSLTCQQLKSFCMLDNEIVKLVHSWSLLRPDVYLSLDSHYWWPFTQTYHT